MVRRPRPSPPAPFGLDDPEAQRPRSRLLSRRNLLWAVGLVLAGIAWGAAVHLADSLPIDMGFIASILKVVVGLAFAVGLIVRLLISGFDLDRVALIACLAVGGASIGLNAGPAVASPATVVGTFTFAPSLPAGAPVSAGALECEWASGRWEIGVLRAASIEGLRTVHRLTLDLLRKTMSLANETGSELWAFGAGAFTSPADAPPRGEGDRSGTLDLVLLQVGIDSAPSDPNEVRGRFSWECPGPPPA